MLGVGRVSTALPDGALGARGYLGGGLRVELGAWRGWGEARNSHRDRGRGRSEMAPVRELKAAAGGSGCLGNGEGLPRRGRAGCWGPPEPS